MSAFMADQGAPNARLSYQDGTNKIEFGVLDGPYGTGEAVVGATNSKAREIVKRCNDKALVVETESWGVHRAVYESMTTGKNCKRILTIKGVADAADEAKDDSRQYRATRNAFETLRALASTLARTDLA